MLVQSSKLWSMTAIAVESRCHTWKNARGISPRSCTEQGSLTPVKRVDKRGTHSVRCKGEFELFEEETCFFLLFSRLVDSF